jgi:para-nitrobenzyl esterase
MSGRNAPRSWRCSVTLLSVALASGACGEHTGLTITPQLSAFATADAATPSDAAASENAAQTGIVVALRTGSVEGKWVGATREFLGIPYAEPPIGDLRFAPPQPVAAWSPIRAAIAYGPACPQPAGQLSSPTPSNENCLYMNVYAPEATGKALPVMVYIHGGAFMRGSADQMDGRWLSEAGPVVVVTFNYRLGPLGFLAHPALDAARGSTPSGNDGIRDQQLALKFVRDNAAAFGGDPENITLFGESAGSVSTCVHFVSPGSQGIAKRYIMESGACVGGGYGVVSQASAAALSAQLAAALCPDAVDVLSCLRQQSPAALVQWQSTKTVFGANWHPSVDGVGGVLPNTPEQLLADPAFKALPAIIGTNQNEWGLFETVGLFQGLPYSLITSIAGLDSAIDQQFGAGADMVEQQYMPDSDALANAAYTRLITDIEFRCPARKLARLASAKSSAVYLYSFEEGTAVHAAELPYVFGSDPSMTAPAMLPLMSAMQSYWAQFATTGNPNGANLPTWPPYNSASAAELTLVDSPHASDDPSESDCDFWDAYSQAGGTIDLGF